MKNVKICVFCVNVYEKRCQTLKIVVDFVFLSIFMEENLNTLASKLRISRKGRKGSGGERHVYEREFCAKTLKTTNKSR